MSESRIQIAGENTTAREMSGTQISSLGPSLAMAGIAAAQATVLVWSAGHRGAAFLACVLAPAAYSGCLALWTLARGMGSPPKSDGSEMLGLAVTCVLAAAAWEVLIVFIDAAFGTQGFDPRGVALVVLPAVLLVGIAHQMLRGSFSPTPAPQEAQR